MRPRPGPCQMDGDDRIPGAAAQPGPQRRELRALGARHGSTRATGLPIGRQDARAGRPGGAAHHRGDIERLQPEDGGGAGRGGQLRRDRRDPARRRPRSGPRARRLRRSRTRARARLRRRGGAGAAAVTAQLLVLALNAALSPTLLAAVVILLAQPRRRPLLTAYLAGGMTISIGLGLGIIAVLEGTSAVSSSSSGASWVTDLAVGGLALLLAVALATQADARFSERRRARHPGEALDRDEEKKEPLPQLILARCS